MIAQSESGLSLNEKVSTPRHGNPRYLAREEYLSSSRGSLPYFTSIRISDSFTSCIQLQTSFSSEASVPFLSHPLLSRLPFTFLLHSVEEGCIN